VTYFDEDEAAFKEKLEELDKDYDLGQDSAIELLEDILGQLKTQEYMLPSLKQALDEPEVQSQ